MKKPFHHGYPWLFIDIQNSILDVLFNYGIHDFGIHNLVIDIYPKLKSGYPYLDMNIYNSRQLWIPMLFMDVHDSIVDIHIWNSQQL